MNDLKFALRQLRKKAFCVVTALGTGFVFGPVPALQSLRFEVFPALKKESSADGGSRGRFQLKHWLVAGQLALCLVLLLGAGLCCHGHTLAGRRGEGHRGDGCFKRRKPTTPCRF